jgi:DNA polymerase beta
MRQIAIEKGYKLSEYAITKQLPDKSYSDPLPVTSEKDVFDYLGMEYLEPEERDL